MELLMKRVPFGFAPDVGEDEKLHRFKSGDVVKCKITVPRNLGFHRKYFAMLNEAFKFQDIYDNFDDFREAMLIVTGFFRWSKTYNGDVVKRASSISFGKMDQVEFEKVYSRTLDAFISIVGGDERHREYLENQVLNFL